MRKKVKFCDICQCHVAHHIFNSVGCIVPRCIQRRRISKATGSFVHPGGME